MIQLRKKDYLQKIIEDLFIQLNQLKTNSGNNNKDIALENCFAFFHENFNVMQDDNFHELIKKVTDIDFLEQYAKLLYTKFEAVDLKDTSDLQLAVDIILYIECIDKTFSWERTILREDLLRLLSIS